MRQDHFVAVCIYFFPYSIANWNLRCVLFLRLLRKFFWFLYITLNAWQIFKSVFFSIFVTALTISSLFFNPFVTLVLSTRKLLHILITSLVNKLPSFESLTSALNLALWEILLRFVLGSPSSFRTGSDCFKLPGTDSKFYWTAAFFLFQVQVLLVFDISCDYSFYNFVFAFHVNT